MAASLLHTPINQLTQIIINKCVLPGKTVSQYGADTYDTNTTP